MFAKIPWLSIGRFSLIVLCLILVLGLVVTILPIHLDITAFKGPVEGVLTAIVKAPVTLDEVTLHPSLWPSLRVFNVEVAGSGWEGAPQISTIDEVEIKISLPALLRDQVKLKRVFASGATIRAHRPEGHPGNWPTWKSGSSYRITELANVELENVALEWVDHQTIEARAVIDRLEGDISDSRALNLDIRGTVEDSALALTAGGPTLATLTQASDFPLSLNLQLADLALRLDGSISREPRGTKFLFTFDLESPDLAVVRRFGAPNLPEIGGTVLTGQISNRRALLQLTDLGGNVGSMSLHGHLTLARQEGERPHLSGRLSLGTLGLEPWLNRSNKSKTHLNAPLPFSSLALLDIDLKVTLQALTGLETAVEDLSFEIGLDHGSLSVPTTLRVASVPLAANLTIATGGETPELETHVSVRELTLRQLDEIVDIPDNLQGRFGALDLSAVTSGQTVEELVSNLSVEATAKESLVAIEDERNEEPIEVFLSQARATHRPGEPLIASAQGTLLDEFFVIDMQTANLDDLIDSDRWPLRASLHGAGAALEMEGTLEQEATALDFDFDFRVSGGRLGDLHRWVGVPLDVELPYSVQGRWVSAAGTRSLRLDDSSIGRARFYGDFARSTEDVEKPFIAHLHAYQLDLRELRDVSGSVTDLDTQEDKIGIDMPILPSKLAFHDAEIELSVDRLLRDTVDLTRVSASFHFREGRLDSSPFSFAYDTQEFTGEIHLDLREEVPRFSLELRGDGDQLGEILEREGLAEGLAVTARTLGFRIDATGASLRTIIQSADLSGHLADVQWRARPPELDQPVLVHLERVDLSGPRGEPIVLTGSGLIEQAPLDLELTMRIPEEPHDEPARSLPFEANLELADTRVALRGEAHLPIAGGNFDLQMLVEGESLTTLSVLTDSQLPDIGPYRLETRAILTDAGYSFKDLDLTVEESDIRGELGYLRVDGRPTFSADLTSRRLRTEDFFELEPPAEPEVESRSEVKDTQQSKPEEPEKLDKATRLTLENFNGFDAKFNLEADEIVTIDGEVEELLIAADLHRGSLDLLVQRPLPDGKSAEITAQVRPWGRGIEAAVQAAWDRAQYGLVGDLFRLDAAGGSWGADLDLTSRGESIDELTANLSGYINFTDYPKAVNSTILDLWGGGLINSVLPMFQLGPESNVNCTVARFQVANGVLTPTHLLIDSTRTRVSGKGSIDLPANKTNLRLKPRPKKRNLINLSTPVTIRGPISDPDIQVSKSGLAVTFFRLSLWVYTVWRDLARKPLPTDGSDICVDPSVELEK